MSQNGTYVDFSFILIGQTLHLYDFKNSTNRLSTELVTKTNQIVKNIYFTSKLQKKCPIWGYTEAPAFLRSTDAMPDMEQLLILVNSTASRRSRWRAKSHQHALREKPPSTGTYCRYRLVFV